MKLNGTHQLLVCTDGVNKLGGSVNTIKEKEALIVACNEAELEVNAGKYMAKCQEQNAG